MAITNQPKTNKVYLTETEAAEYLGLKAGTLRNWRKDSVGPAYSRLSVVIARDQATQSRAQRRREDQSPSRDH